MKKVSHTVKVIAPRYELPKCHGPQDGIDMDEKTGRWFSVFFQGGKVRYKLFTRDFEESCRKRNKCWANWRRKGIAFDSPTRVYGERKARRRPVLTPCTTVMADGTIKRFGSLAQRAAFLRRRKVAREYEPMKEIKCKHCKGEAMVVSGDDLIPCPKCKGNGSVKVPVNPKPQPPAPDGR